MGKRQAWMEWLGSDSVEAGPGSERVRVSAVVAVVLVAGLVVWLLVGGGDDDSGQSEADTASQTLEVVTAAALPEALEDVGYPVYWAGPRPGVEYEVSHPADGQTYLRYLPEGAEAESEEQFMTVGSYQQEDAIESVRDLGSKPGAILIRLPDGGAAYSEGADATSAYLAFPGDEVQVEVYDPEPGRALQTIRSGAIVPVG